MFSELKNQPRMTLVLKTDKNGLSSSVSLGHNLQDRNNQAQRDFLSADTRGRDFAMYLGRSRMQTNESQYGFGLKFAENVSEDKIGRSAQTRKTMTVGTQTDYRYRDWRAFHEEFDV